MYEYEQVLDLSGMAYPFDLISGLDDDTLYISDYGPGVFGNYNGGVAKASISAKTWSMLWTPLPRPQYLSISQPGNVFVSTRGAVPATPVGGGGGPGEAIWKLWPDGTITLWWQGEQPAPVLDPDNPWAGFDNVFASQPGDPNFLYGPNGIAMAPNEEACVVCETEYNWFGSWSQPNVSIVIPAEYPDAKQRVWSGHTSISLVFDLDTFVTTFGMQLDWDSGHFWFLSDSELVRINVNARDLDLPRHDYVKYPFDTFQRYYSHGYGSPAQAYGTTDKRSYVYYATGSTINRYIVGSEHGELNDRDVTGILDDWNTHGYQSPRWNDDGVLGYAGQASADNVAVTPNGEVYFLDRTNKKVHHLLIAQPGTVQYGTPDLRTDKPRTGFQQPKDANIYFQYFPKTHPHYSPAPGQT